MAKALVFLLVLGTGFFAWTELRIPAPCTEPIKYALGSFDTRFDISRENFLSALAEAESIWEKALGKELFVYAPEKGKLSVNLIYDERQEVTEALSVIEGEVAQEESSYRTLEKEYLSLKAEHEVLKKTYEAQVSAFEKRNALYEQAVENWNRGERTSRKEFEALESERRFLESEAKRLKNLEGVLNSLVRDINEKVSELNALAKELNLNVSEYNTIGASRGETFAGGIYTSDALGERIDIFEFENREKLIRVLAHELGHALGLDHVEDPNAMMYHLNHGVSGVLTAADINALQTLCAVE